MARPSTLIRLFQEESHAEDLIGGTVYANQVPTFKSREPQDPAKRLDANEGIIVRWTGNEGGIELLLGHSGLRTTDVESVQIQPRSIDHLHLYCMLASNANGDFSEQCRSFGSFGVMITDVDQFIERFKAAMTARAEEHECDISLWFGPIRYVDPSLPLDPVSDIASLTRKSTDYDYQKEFRFIIDSGEDGSGPLILQIGNLSDIAHRITV